jgi:UDP-N-acetylmuramoyl-L-alanyl-D-glutamate--2,6-diaminopimelate ligase
MILSHLIADIDIREFHGSYEMEINSIAYDSRKCTEGCLFAALSGTRSDGHEFIATAIEKGARAIICEKLDEDFRNLTDITFIIVPDSRRALALAAHEFYGNPTQTIKIIGVTGTNGKTTTTYLLKSIFEEAGFKCGLIGTTGIMIGDEMFEATHTTPESLELAEIFRQMADRKTEYALMEVSSHSLDQSRVAGIDFDVALFTNLTPDHLDYHKDMQDYARAKKKLFDGLKPNAKAIIFQNSEFSEFLAIDCHADVRFIGRTGQADIEILNEKIGLGSLSYLLKMNDENGFTIQSGLSGSFNIDNSALAFSAAYLLGITPEIIQSALVNSAGAPGRMQSLRLKNGALALVDYAHTPDALEKALASCRGVLDSAGKRGSLIAVFGCGGDRDRTKRPVMGSISSHLADRTIITSDNPRTENAEDIIREIVNGILPGQMPKVEIIANRAEAIRHAVASAEPDDIVLVAGKGHENYQVIGTEKHHFDDSEEIRKSDGK